MKTFPLVYNHPQSWNRVIRDFAKDVYSFLSWKDMYLHEWWTINGSANALTDSEMKDNGFIQKIYYHEDAFPGDPQVVPIITDINTYQGNIVVYNGAIGKWNGSSYTKVTTTTADAYIGPYLFYRKGYINNVEGRLFSYLSSTKDETAIVVNANELTSKIIPFPIGSAIFSLLLPTEGVDSKDNTLKTLPSNYLIVPLGYSAFYQYNVRNDLNAIFVSGDGGTTKTLFTTGSYNPRFIYQLDNAWPRDSLSFKASSGTINQNNQYIAEIIAHDKAIWLGQTIAHDILWDDELVIISDKNAISSANVDKQEVLNYNITIAEDNAIQFLNNCKVNLY